MEQRIGSLSLQNAARRYSVQAHILVFQGWEEK